MRFQVVTKKKRLKKKEEFDYYGIDKNQKEKSESSFGSFSILFIIMSSLFYTFYVFQKKAELKKELIEIKKDTVVNKKERRHFDLVQENIVDNDSVDNNVVFEKIVSTSISQEDSLSFEKNRSDYIKDEKNNLDYCIHTNLSYKYDYKIFVKKRLNKNNEIIIEKIFISVIDKYSNLEQQNIVLTKEKNKDYFDFYDDYSNCNLVISYITGVNIKFVDYYYSDFIVGDFNFDSKEDFAVKINNSNLGAAYFFYTMSSDGKFRKGNFPIMKIPTKIDFKNKTITNSYNVGCCEGYDDIFKYNKSKDEWVLIKSTHKKYN